MVEDILRNFSIFLTVLFNNMCDFKLQFIKFWFQIEPHHKDDDFLNLIREIHNKNIPGHPYRGYTILGDASKLEILVSRICVSWFYYVSVVTQ